MAAISTFGKAIHAADRAYGYIQGERAQGEVAPAFAEGLLTQLKQLHDLLQAGQKARMAKR